MSKIYSNEKLIEDFKKKINSGCLSHAYIIEGAQGTGKKTLARYLSAMINCKSEDAPCGHCPSCLKIFSSSHSDVHEILQSDTSKQIVVSAVRQIKEDAYILPGESERNIFIIENCQCMNSSAQNAFLKLLEEPPQSTLFFLLTTNRKMLLPTVLSRAHVVKTEPLSNNMLIGILSEKFPETSQSELASVISICSGSLGRACEILSEQGVSDLMSTVESYVNEAFEEKRGSVSLSDIISPFSTDRKKYQQIIPVILLALRDIVVYKAGGCDRLFYQDDYAVERIARKTSLRRAVILFEECERLNKTLSYNPNALLFGSVLNDTLL